MKTYLSAIFSALLICFYLSSAFGGEIHKAAKQRDLKQVERLLKSIANVDSKDKNGQTALYVAAKEGYADVVAVLLGAGADATITAKGKVGLNRTPLHVAVTSGDIETVRAILKTGIDPNLKNTVMGPPLHIAITWDESEIANLLREHGAVAQEVRSISNKIATADISRGKWLASGCKSCHGIDNRDAMLGRPSLWGILGKPKAYLSGYDYSQALKAKGGIWDYDALNSLLYDPLGFIPGTKMLRMPSIKSEEDRAAILAFLRTQADTPYPLPSH